MIELSHVSVRGPIERGGLRPVLRDVTFEQRNGVLAVVGAYKDGTALLFDVIDGTARPISGRVTVFGGSPDAARARVARVSIDAPLPDAMRVDEVCDLAADVRDEAKKPAAERLGILGLAGLARRRVRSLSIDERRAVLFAIALTSKAEVLLVEEPLALDPVAPRLVIDALRARAASACVMVTTGSPRDAVRLGDRLGVLSAGAYMALPAEAAHMPHEGDATVRVVVGATHGKAGAGALVAALGADEAVARVDTSVHAGGAVMLAVFGRDVVRLAAAITRAIAERRVDVELIEPATLPLDAITLALAAPPPPPPPPAPPPLEPAVPATEGPEPPGSP